MATEMPVERKMKPGTLYSYIAALRMFASHLLIEGKLKANDLMKVDSSTTFIRKSVTKAKKQREAELEAEVEGNLITGPEIEVSTAAGQCPHKRGGRVRGPGLYRGRDIQICLK